jgi:hypothetical protein
LSTEDAIRRTLESVNESDRNFEPANVVDGLFAISRSISELASAVRDLGNGNAATPMGAIEAFGVIVKQQLDSISVSLGCGFSEIAEALNNLQLRRANSETPGPSTEREDPQPGYYWVWHRDEWRIGKWDGEDWDVDGWSFSHELPVGPRLLDPPKEPPIPRRANAETPGPSNESREEPQHKSDDMGTPKDGQEGLTTE